MNRRLLSPKTQTFIRFLVTVRLQDLCLRALSNIDLCNFFNAFRFLQCTFAPETELPSLEILFKARTRFGPFWNGQYKNVQSSFAF